MILTHEVGGEHYALSFDADSSSAAKKKVGQWASDPELNFTWYDAAVVCQKINRALVRGLNE